MRKISLNKKPKPLAKRNYIQTTNNDKNINLKIKPKNIINKNINLKINEANNANKVSNSFNNYLYNNNFNNTANNFYKKNNNYFNYVNKKDNGPNEVPTNYNTGRDFNKKKIEYNNNEINDINYNTSKNFYKKNIDYNNNNYITYNQLTSYINNYTDINLNEKERLKGSNNSIKENENSNIYNKINEGYNLKKSKTEKGELNKDLNIFKNNKNIFNLSLIILSNINYIYNFFINEQNYDKIKEIYKINKYSLTAILFYIIRNKDKIKSNSEPEETHKNNFIFSWIGSERSNSDNLIDINKLEEVIERIYSKINNELTMNNKSQIVNYNFIKNFQYISIIEKQCKTCKKNKRIQRLSYIINNDEIQYLSGQIRNGTCNFCNKKTTDIYKPLSLPKIFTILINDNENNDFEIEDSIKIANEIFLLISIICYYNNKYIIYYINIKDGLWHIISGEMKGKVESMNINHIPLMLIYQTKKEFPFPNYINLPKNKSKDIFLKQNNKLISYPNCRNIKIK